MNLTTQVVLITGIAGFIGRYVARHFRQQGLLVVGVDRSSPENAPLADLVTYYQTSLPSSEFIEIVKRHQPQICIHSAGRASVGLSIKNPAEDFYTNTVLTFEVLNTLRLYAPECRFIFLSSAAVYGNPQSLPVTESSPCKPLSPYGFHKWQCEQLCIEFTTVYGLPTTSVRIFSAYGSGLRRQVIWDICQKLMTQGSLNLQGTGRESRDFIHVADIAKALNLITMQAPMRGEVYNLATGNETPIIELANKVINALGSKCIPEFDGVVPVGNPLNWRADISKLKELGFQPSMSLDAGVQSFVNWCKAELLHP